MNSHINAPSVNVKQKYMTLFSVAFESFVTYSWCPVVIKARFPTFPTRRKQGTKHASNLTQAVSRVKFQPCHWPFLAYGAFVAFLE